MRAAEFLLLVEGYKEATAEFTQVAPAQMVNDTITRFRDLVNRNQVQGQERNIDYWRKQGWDAFKLVVDKKGAEASKTQVKRKKVVGKSVFLREDDQWLIVIPLDKNASCFYGKNSSWCTTKPDQNYFEQYFYRKDVVLVYCIRKQDGNMFAIAGHPDLTAVEIFNQQDQSMSPVQFKRATGLDPQQIMQEAMSKFGADIKAAKGPYVATANELKKLIPTLTQRDPEVEKKLLQLKDGAIISNYVSTVLPGVLIGNATMPADFPKALLLPLISYNPLVLKSIPNQTEQEQFAAVDTIWGGEYVRNPTPRVIDRALTRHGRNIEFFPVDYETMIKYPRAAAHWAKQHKRRVPEAEEAILRDPEALITYLNLPLGQPWLAAETTILNDPNSYEAVFRYAKNFLKDRWPEGEKRLLNPPSADAEVDAPYILYRYADEVIGKRWPEAEPIIIKDPDIAASYAMEVMKRRWPEAEDAMLEVDPEQSDSDRIQKYFDFIGSLDYRYEWSDYFDQLDRRRGYYDDDDF